MAASMEDDCFSAMQRMSQYVVERYAADGSGQAKAAWLYIVE